MALPEKQLEQLRSFNRTVTRKFGVLEDDFLGRDRPLGESRLLYEIGSEGSEVRSLRMRMALDSGYLSRLLRSLEKQGLVTTGSSPQDARVRFVSLTNAGQTERETLDQLSNDLAESVLSALDYGQRARLISAMTTVEQLLQASETSIEAEAPDSETARWCIAQYYALLNERFEEGYDPGKAQSTGDADFAPPNGIFLVARIEGRPVGCIALRGLEPHVGEIKRLWVDNDARRRGLGQRLLSAAEYQARTFRFRTIRLDTNKSLTEAQALYHKNGYTEVPAFNDDPYPDHWFEKEL